MTDQHTQEVSATDNKVQHKVFCDEKGEENYHCVEHNFTYKNKLSFLVHMNRYHSAKKSANRNLNVNDGTNDDGVVKQTNGVGTSSSSTSSNNCCNQNVLEKMGEAIRVCLEHYFQKEIELEEVSQNADYLKQIFELIVLTAAVPEFVSDADSGELAGSRPLTNASELPAAYQTVHAIRSLKKMQNVVSVIEKNVANDMEKLSTVEAVVLENIGFFHADKYFSDMQKSKKRKMQADDEKRTE